MACAIWICGRRVPAVQTDDWVGSVTTSRVPAPARRDASWYGMEQETNADGELQQFVLLGGGQQ